MRIFVHLSYKGTSYRGWQRQAASIPLTVQQIVEEALVIMLKYDCYISGCGRTDAGVHASTFYFSLDLKKSLDFDFCERLNRVLPNDIVAIKQYEVEDSQNTRFDAYERIYNYYFHLNSNPFDAEISTFIDCKLDIDIMIAAAAILSKMKDFKFLCKQPEKHRTTTCSINYIRFYTNKARTHYRVEISADRFLRGMIRIMMSRLFMIGNGKISLHEFELWINGQFDTHSKPAYPQGLFLTDVKYEFLDSGITVIQNMPNQKAWLPLK